MKRMRQLIGILGLASGVLLGASPVFAISLSSSHPVVRQTLAPGAVVQGSIELTNSGKDPLTIRLYLEDWRYLPQGDGSKEFTPPGTTPRSCADWIRFRPSQVVVPAGEKTAVDYTISVPEDASLDGGYYAVLFFESLILGQEVDAKDEVSIRYAARLGSLFLVEIEGTARQEGELRSAVVAPPSAGAPLKLQGQLANTGNVSLKCAGTFHAMGAGQVVAARGELPARYVWPGDAAPLEAEWPGQLSPGAYSVVLTYECGEDLVLVEELPLSVQ